MAITIRETPHKPGPHPHRSTFASFEAHAIITKSPHSPPDTSINTILLQPSACTETCSSTADQDHVRLQEIPPNNITERTSVPHTVHRNTSPDQNHTRPTTRSVDRSVNWSHSADDQHEEEAVMQISGAGHWFLEGWIGDHAVDFLVDSGSAVTAVSGTFYKTLMGAGAPVGDLRPTTRRLRSANGSQIDILGCSFCLGSFLELRAELPILVHYQDVCSPWDIARFHHIRRQFFTVPLGLWVAGRCRPVDCS